MGGGGVLSPLIVAFFLFSFFFVGERTRLRLCFELDCSKEEKQRRKGTLRGGLFSEPDSMFGK